MSHITFAFNLFDLKKNLEKQRGEEISWAEIGRRSGIHPNTLTALQKGRARRVDLDTLEKLYHFFLAEGFQIAPGDFFKLEQSPN